MIDTARSSTCSVGCGRDFSSACARLPAAEVQRQSGGRWHEHGGAVNAIGGPFALALRWVAQGLAQAITGARGCRGYRRLTRTEELQQMVR